MRVWGFEGFRVFRVLGLGLASRILAFPFEWQSIAYHGFVLPGAEPGAGLMAWMKVYPKP